MDLDKGTYVWAKSRSDEIPRACKILSIEESQIKVQDDNGQEFSIAVKSILKRLHPSSLCSVEDMISLGELEDYTILRNLHLRFKNNLIYTYIGAVLVAVNPYQTLPIYGDNYKNEYKRNNVAELPPHIYASGKTCYHNLINQRKSQCIVISGESGSGKTESTKLLLDYLASLCGKKTPIDNQITQANPILEAFGNAKTVYNDNSSRFGKLIELFFNESGNLVCASIKQYLLEKSRVTELKMGDQNYHIFYSLISGLSWDEKCQLDLKSCQQFEYLNKADPKMPLALRETTDLESIKESMKLLNFSDEDIWNIYLVTAAILHLGNIKYSSNLLDNIEGTEIKDGSSLDNVCKLLKVEKHCFKDTFSKKTIYIQGHTTISSVSMVQATMTRNGFVKTLFHKLFYYIVEKINETLFKGTPTKYCLRILDIFGFENFNNNSFEQLCINYTNENLQQIFVNHIFKIEQEEYKKEGIIWEHINFVDNEDILNLIGLCPNSLLKIIDEQSQLITGSDFTLISKMNSIHEYNKFYVKEKSNVSLSFGLLHYAGKVVYRIEGFIQKNRNPLTNNCLQLIKTSQSLFIKNLFSKELTTVKNIKKSNCQTVSSQYQNSLSTLLSLISASQPYFIRCIKPNLNQLPKVFDYELCCCQLRYSGLMETAIIRRSGYPIQYKYSDFNLRFGIILESSLTNNEKQLSFLICKYVLGKDDYQFGESKVFLKIKHDYYLEMARNKILEKKIVIVQKNFRMLNVKKRFSKIKQSVLLIQKIWRGYRAKKTYLVQKIGFLRLQASIKSRQATYDYTKLRCSTAYFQAKCRGFLFRKNISKKNKKQKLQKKTSSIESCGDVDAYITKIFESALDDGLEISSL